MFARHILCAFFCAAVIGIGNRSTLLGDDDKPEKPGAADIDQNVTQGALRIQQPDGGVVECPLKHTDVKADIAGFIARVRVTQTFHNPTQEKIEAVYVFPLPHEGAVDDMTMVIGDRKIVGIIKRRAEARSIYQQALLAGQTAALLEQERPNIFTQSVGNIEPGQEVRIEISYVDVLRYDLGNYEFHFPMVVGPRYIPGSPSGSGQPDRQPGLIGRVSPPVANTDQVPDASRISPPVLKPGFRNGHDVSLSVSLDAGVPIQDLKSANHQVELQRQGDRAASIKLSPADSVPNKDFVLRYGVAGQRPEMALLAHTGDYSADRQRLGKGYFMLMIQPREDDRLTKSPPRELVFLVDVSGSMSGHPTAKVIEAMQGMLRLCRPQDTVQVVTFASQAHSLFAAPVPVTEENIAKAIGFTAGLRGGGGTEMLTGVKLAIEQPLDKKRMRIVVMLTDGYIGNEAAIIEHVGQHCGDQIRFWCLGIGSSPNMFLVDGVARQGGGMGKKLGLDDETQPLVQEIMTRIQRAQLANVTIDWGDLQVRETFPARIPDLWAGRPIIVYGRYGNGGGRAEIQIKGQVEGEPVSWPLAVNLPSAEPQHDVLAKVWSRQKIENLMQQAYYRDDPAVEEEVTALALDYRLMSQYTSFVAVDAKEAATSPSAQPPRRMLVPVPLPAGTRWEGFFGEEGPLDGVMLEGEALRLGDRPASNPHPLSDNFSLGQKKSVVKYFRESLVAPGKQLARTPLAAGRRYAAGATFSGLGAQQPVRGRRMALQLLTEVKDVSALVVSLEETASQKELGYLSRSVLGEASSLAPAAQQAFAQATEAKSDRAAQGRWLERACWLDSAAANFGQSDGGLAQQAIEKLQELHQANIAEWRKNVPQLQSRLDLELRNLSIPESLRKLSAAAQLPIQFVEGSDSDAAALTTGGELPHVSYLDLRNATVADALDWLLQPHQLTWWVDGQQVLAGSQRRRMGAETGWVYDVRAMVLSTPDEFKDEKDEAKIAAAVEKSVKEFVTAVRKSLRANEESVLWYSSGKLLVFGTPDRHAAAQQLFADLAAGKRTTLDVSPELAAACQRRFVAHTKDLSRVREAARLYDAAQVHQHFGWQLLSSARTGHVDLEALTELQHAWDSETARKLLSGGTRTLMLRSLWTICQSSRELPEDRELSGLAAKALQLSQGAANEALDEMVKDKTSSAATAGTIYFALAASDNQEYRAKAQTQLAAPDGEGTPNLRLLGRILLSPSTDSDLRRLEALISAGDRGVDEVALLALACHQSGGAAWNQFRANSERIVGSQPLPGELIVLLNRW